MFHTFYFIYFSLKLNDWCFNMIFIFFTTIMSELLLHFTFLRISYNFYNISFYKSTQFTFNNSLVISVPTVEPFTLAFYID